MLCREFSLVGPCPSSSSVPKVHEVRSCSRCVRVRDRGLGSGYGRGCDPVRGFRVHLWGLVVRGIHRDDRGADLSRPSSLPDVRRGVVVSDVRREGRLRSTAPSRAVLFVSRVPT